MTYGDYLKEVSMAFGIDWKERRKLIAEMINIELIESGIVLLDPCTGEKL